jgi:hypothetical protein
MLDSYSPLSRGLVEGGDVPVDRSHPRPPLAPLREGREHPRGAARLHLAPCARAPRLGRADAADRDHRRQYRLGEPLRASPELCGGKLPNYTTAAGGRSFPSSAGFNTTEFFFTDDTGVYFLPTRDMTPSPEVGDKDLHAWVEAHRASAS